MKNNQSYNFSSYQIFQGLGYIVGGLVPVAVFISFEMSGLKQGLLSEISINLFVILSFIGLFMSIISLYVELRYSRESGWFGIIFTMQALFSFFLIHLLVLYTGGPKSSVFGLSYLYIPAVVGYTFGKGWSLYGAALLLSVSYILNLFFVAAQQTFLNNYTFIKYFLNDENLLSDINDTAGKDGAWIYIFVFLLQVMVTTLIASERTYEDDDIYKKKQTS